MDARIGLANPVASKVVKYLVSADRAVSEAGLPATTLELVKLRASQINGCAVLHRHAHQGRRGTPGRARSGSTWWRRGGRPRSSPTPSGPPWNSPSRAPASPTRPAACHDEAWANAAKHYDDDQLAALVCQIAVINAYNRLNVIVRQPAGDYQPGQFG